MGVNLTEKEIENIIDQFDEAKYLKLKAKKIIDELVKKYDLTKSQIWCIGERKKKNVMRRYDGNQINQAN